ncbi:hypothetical protein HMPREF1247_1391 [Atopobium sp. BV3Ac4]|nr:hypothetical protein HMPREF1247_1391 [Atopobium sp. BV3Ac4]
MDIVHMFLFSSQKLYTPKTPLFFVKGFFKEGYCLFKCRALA